MEKNLGSLKIDDEHYSFSESQTGFKCTGCSGTFQKPIVATVSSRGYVTTYYACPRCLSKISDVKQHKDEEDEEEKGTLVALGKVKKIAVAKHEENVSCKHFLGYLKKRSKDSAIPDDCLTCDKMIECMVH
jgi:DNA-directed RNA polymerase subunit RPC12/RpoP